MKAYRVYNCRITGDTRWNGIVVDVNEEGIIEAIKKKFGLKYLYCEKFPDKRRQERNEAQFGYSAVPVESVALEDITIGELIGILRNNNFLASPDEANGGEEIGGTEK